MSRRSIAAFGGIAAVLALMSWVRLGPLPTGLLDLEGDVSTTVVDRHGAVLYESRAGDGTRGAWLREDMLPPHLVSATIAAEDHRFFSHPGVDLLATVRAAARNLREGAFVEGGSTITQQVAKLLLARIDAAAPRKRSLGSKLREAVVALRLEHRMVKREILTLYLNLAPYGNQIQGAERASRAYFGAPAASLTPAQAAFIAGLPQRPSRFNPFRNTAAALARQKQVLERMARLGLVSPATIAEANAERLTLTRQDDPFVAPHFVEMVLARSAAHQRRIETTLDRELQRDVQGIIRGLRPLLDRHRAYNVAVVVLKNDTGEWLAWEGSGDYADADHGGAVNGPLALRQPGSALKPFTYALAFEEGRSPATVLADVPAHFPTAEDGVAYSPRNYDGRFRGPLLARRALAGSENVPAVALAAELGVAKLVRLLRKAGLSTFDQTAAHYGLGMTLGNAEVRLAELVAAYASFARGGVRLEPAAIRGGVRDEQRIVSPRTAFWITDILADADAREYIFGRGGSLEFPFAVAAKTGTSEGYHDNWAVGYTREVTVGVWVGNFDRAPLTNSSGVTGAGPVFHAVMLAAQKRVAGQVMVSDELFAAVPSAVRKAPVCALSGMSANEWCPSRVTEWVPIEASAPPCSWHHLDDDRVVTEWPPAYRQWARDHGLAAGGRLERVATEFSSARVSRRPSTRVSNDGRRLAIVNPPADAIYLIDPTLRRRYQTLALRASADRDAGRISWSVDGQAVGVADADSPMHWPLSPGTHTIVAADARGRTAETNIVVK